MMKRIAILSDVHGNLLALEAVERDLRALGVDAVVNLGDCLSGPLWPRETAERLMQTSWMHVMGNHDREVCFGDAALLGLSDSFAFQNTTPDQRSWLGSLPKTRIVAPGIMAFHGSPQSDTDYLLEEISGGRKVLRPLQEIERSLPKKRGLYLCGHSHLPRCVRLSNGSLVLNPGSVGLQAYEEDSPLPYRVENGSPHARYLVLEKRAEDWAAQFCLVEYPWKAAAEQARKEGRLDWEAALLTGFSSTGAG